MTIQLFALSLSQSCYWFAVLIAISLSSIIGINLAPHPLLATAPYGLISLGALIATYKLSVFMQHYGRRKGLRLGAMAGVGSALLAVVAILLSNFYVFCLASLLMGVYQASSVFYRLAAIDGVAEGQQGRIMGWVLSGSLLAAVLGPSLAIQANRWIEPAYVGAYLLAAVFAVIAFVLLGQLSKQSVNHSLVKSSTKKFLKQPRYLIGVFNTAFTQFLMILMMIVTPLSMHAGHHSDEQGLSVIGWHIIGMFLPSFFSGKMIDKFGTQAMILSGLLILMLSAGAAIIDMALINYYVSLFLLGVGWNFIYMAGTSQYTQAIENSEKGRAQGYSEVVIASSGIIAVIAGGALIHWFDWQQINLGALFLLVGVVFLNLKYRG